MLSQTSAQTLSPNPSSEPNLTRALTRALSLPLTPVQAAVLSGTRDANLNDVLLIDVAPLTLGIEDASGLMSALVPRGTAVPVSKKKVYSTSHDGQTAVTNKVYEGERKVAHQNRLLGSFELSGFPPMPRGVAQIEVSQSGQRYAMVHHGV